MDTLLADIRYAARTLRKAPGLTAVAVVVLALGVGANTAIFSVVNAVLLRPMPYPDADRLVTLAECALGPSREPESSSPANYLDWKAESRAFESMAAYRGYYFNLAGDGEPERLGGAIVTGDFFRVFGVGAALGRTIEPGDTTSRVAVLGDGLWRRRYGGASDVVGRRIMLNGESYTVVGVMPREFRFPEGAQVWAASRFAVPENPLSPNADLSASRDRQYFDVVARLAPRVAPEAAQADLDVVAARLAVAYPDTNEGRGVALVGLRDATVGDARPALVMLLGAVGFVLLIACANVANLLVARAATRRREMATRAALGATRWRLVRQLLAESLLLSAAGGAAGLGLAAWGIGPLVAFAPAGMLGAVEPSVDWRVLGFAVAASALTGLLFGLLPAAQASRVDVNEVLKEGARGSTGGGRGSRVRGLLVVFEIAISLVLLAGAGLMLKSLARLGEVDLGFEPRELVTAQVWLSAGAYAEPERRAEFFAAALERVRAIPGVRAAGASTRLPLAGGNSARGFTIEGRPSENPMTGPSADYRAVSPDFFRAMGVPVLAGREFTDRDSAGALPVAVVNEALAREYFPGEDPVGRRLDVEGKGVFREIVGVVGSVHHDDLVTRPRAELYAPFAQDPWPFMTLAVRTSSPPDALARELEDAVRAVDPAQPVANVVSMEALVSKSVAPRRFSAALLGLFAAVALLLSAVGLYGVVSYSVAQRVHEIGIRMALGAGRRDVFRLVVGRAVLLAAGGVACGLAAAFALTRAISGMLFGVSATDPAVFAAVALVLGGTAVLASVLPARRATRVDPMTALRCE